MSIFYIYWITRTKFEDGRVNLYLGGKINSYQSSCTSNLSLFYDHLQSPGGVCKEMDALVQRF